MDLVRSSRRWLSGLLAALAAVLVIGGGPGTPASAQGDPCSDPQFRATLQQAEQQFAQVIRQYYSLPPDGKAAIDSAVRQAFRGSGYSVSSLPDLQRQSDVCRSSAPAPSPTVAPEPQPGPGPNPDEPQAGPGPNPNPPPGRTSPTLRPPVTLPFVSGVTGLVGTLASGAASLRRVLGLMPARKSGQGPLSASEADGIPIGSGQVKLGWVLYGRTDLTDQEAQERYRASVKVRTDALEAEDGSSKARLEALKRKSQTFEEGVAAKNPQAMVGVLTGELVDARDQHARNLRELGVAMAGLTPGGVGEAVHGISGTAELARFAAIAGEKTASGAKLSSEDWGLAANGFASSVSAVGASVKSTVGLPIGVTQAGFALMNAYGSQSWVDSLEKGIAQTNRPIEENRRLLKHQMDLEEAQQRWIHRQIDGLNQEARYLDFVRP